MAAKHPSIVSHDEFLRRFRTAGDKLDALEHAQRNDDAAVREQRERQHYENDEELLAVAAVLARSSGDERATSEAQRPPPSTAARINASDEHTQDDEKAVHPYASTSDRAPPVAHSRETSASSSSRPVPASSSWPIRQGTPRTFHYPTRIHSPQAGHSVSTNHDMRSTMASPVSQSGFVSLVRQGPSPAHGIKHERFGSLDHAADEIVSEKGSFHRFTFGDSDSYNRSVDGGHEQKGQQRSGWDRERRKTSAVGLGIGFGTKSSGRSTTSTGALISTTTTSAASEPSSTPSTGSSITSRSSTNSATSATRATTTALPVGTTLPVGATQASEYVYAVDRFTTTAAFVYTVPSSVETRANGQWQWTQSIRLPVNSRGDMTTSEVRVRVWPDDVPTARARSQRQRRLRY